VVDQDVQALRLVRTGGAPRRGDLYLGRVVALRPELPAALIDIGAGRPAFLDVPALPREGEAMIVKVTRPARADKAATVTTKLTTAEEARARRAPSDAPPMLLHRHQTALAVLLDEFDRTPLDEIVIEDESVPAAVRRWLTLHQAQFAGRLIYHREPRPLFEQYGVADEIAAALAPRVALPAGGAVTIEPTLAATLIDVDGGRAGALAANFAAGAEIARQIRLRDLSGPIVIDFVGMKGRGERARLERALEASLAALEVQLLGWTRLGHFELVRPRRRAALTELLFEHRPGAGLVKTPLTVALEALRQLQRESLRAPAARYRLRVHAEVAAALSGEAADARREAEGRLGRAVQVAAEARPRDSFAVEPM
jgi:Ribonuclease G/E